MNVSQAAIHPHSGKQLLDLQTAFNAPPRSVSTETSYNHTTRLGIQLKSARPGNRPSARPSPRRQARSAPAQRQNSGGTHGEGGVGEAISPAKSVTFVKDVVNIVPLYDEFNMHRSHTAASFYSGSTKIKQLPLHPETDSLSHRFTYSCKSRIMPLPIKATDNMDLPLAAPATRGVFSSHASPRQRKGSGHQNQASRYNEEKQLTQRVHLLRTLSDLQSHRVDRRYYVSGQSMAMGPRYSVSEKEIQELLNMRQQSEVVSGRSMAGRPPPVPRTAYGKRSSILKKKASENSVLEPDNQSTNPEDHPVSVSVSVKEYSNTERNNQANVDEVKDDEEGT